MPTRYNSSEHVRHSFGIGAEVDTWGGTGSDDESVGRFLLEIARLSSANPDAFDPEASIARISAELERTDDMQTAFNHATLRTERDWTGRLADVTTPTLVIHGELDPIVPLANGRAWVR